MNIRKATQNALEAIMKIYEIARRYMLDNGNSTQWGENYPPETLVTRDINNDNCYVGVTEEYELHLVFSLIAGEDPTYLKIDGDWLSDTPYSTIHRVASDGKVKGTFAECLKFCKTKSSNLRINTHQDNATMLHLIEKNGFTRCGIIYVRDGSPRVAFQYLGY